MNLPSNTFNYFTQDYPRTLFPLETNRIIITHALNEVTDYVYQKILKDPAYAFLPQARVYASKQGLHVRRTMKLDPIAEFFIYDLVYRNRTSFRKDFQQSRRNFGYRFEQGTILSPSQSYHDFRAAVAEATEKFHYCAKFDISSYFNSVYHHDLAAWFNDSGRSEDDVNGFDQFLRQINAGRSIDCLPQGIDPCKIIGSHFLKFIDNSNRIKSELLLRFMDDFYLFSDEEDIVLEDFALIQRMLGDKGLSVNPLKTRLGEVEHLDIKREVDGMKISLLQQRRRVIDMSGVELEYEDDEPVNLDEEQIEYLFDLLKNNEIEEEDAELVLVLLHDHGDDIIEYIEMFFRKFPNLVRNIYRFCEYVEDKEQIASIINKILRERNYLTEYQLFWIAKIAEDYLEKTNRLSEILNLLYEHPNASTISRAKVLEIPEQRFGMPNLREEHLRTGKSDWLAWAAAIGSRKEKKANRNHLLRYFSNGSPMNRLIADCVTNL